MAKNFKTQSNNEQRWTDVKGVMTLFANKYNGKIILSTSVSKKVDENEFTNFYINVNLPKGTEPEKSGTYKINVKKGFLSCYATKNGDAKLNIVVQEFEIL